MGQTLTAIYLHVIFATKAREPTINLTVMPELHAYLGGVARNLDAIVLSVGGVADHVHSLVSIPTKLSTAELVGKLKSNSSRWMHERGVESFQGQTGYGAFSVSKSNMREVIQCIENQAKHHKVVSFQDEFLAFLKRHDVPYDPRYVWD